MGIFFKYRLNDYNEDYYRIYERRRKLDLSRVPSFRLIRSLLAAKDGEKILDAGCGDGHLVHFFTDGVKCSVYGIDSSDAALSAAARLYPELELSKQDITALDFPDGYFDKIICYNVIEHIADQEKVMNELNRVLKKGGRLIIGTIIKDSICWKLYQLFIGEHTHVREFSVKEFLDFVGRYFRIIRYDVESGVFRLPRPFIWIFHYVLKGDIIINAEKE